MGKGSNQRNGGAEEDGNAVLQGVTAKRCVCYCLGRALQALAHFILDYTSRKQIRALLPLTDKQRKCVPEVVQVEKRSRGFGACGISTSVPHSVAPPQSNSDCNGHGKFHCPKEKCRENAGFQVAQRVEHVGFKINYIGTTVVVIGARIDFLCGS